MIPKFGKIALVLSSAILLYEIIHGAYQTHEDCGYGYKVVCCYNDKYSKYTCIYRGENAVYKFMEKMLEEVEYCKVVIKKHFKTMDGCHICDEK